jgi:CheY-like chemotaxis protein
MTRPLALIVEDDRNLAEIFAITVQKADFETEIARDGQRALDRLAEVVPDLIVLDLNLPYVSGAEILRYIRANERLAGIKVILSTAQEQLAEPLAELADLTLLKPVSPMQLYQLASRLRPPDIEP